MLLRGFLKREQGPLLLLSCLGEPVGALELEAESRIEAFGGSGLTRQGERGGDSWS